MADGFCRALRERGVDPDMAELAAHTASQVFRTAYRQWLEDDGDDDLPTITRDVLSLLSALLPAASAGAAPQGE